MVFFYPYPLFVGTATVQCSGGGEMEHKSAPSPTLLQREDRYLKTPKFERGKERVARRGKGGKKGKGDHVEQRGGKGESSLSDHVIQRG